MSFKNEKLYQVPDTWVSETSSEFTQPPSYSEDTDAPIGQQLQVAYTNWASRHAEVTPVGSKAALYKVDFKNRKPNIRFKVDNNDTPFATVSYHFLTTKIDVELNGQFFVMKKPKSCWSRTYSYESIALQNQTVRWTPRNRWKCFDYVLEDEQGRVIARCRAPSWSLKKVAILEFAEEQGELNEATKQEIVVTGTTVMYLVLMQTIANASAASSASAGAAAAAAAAS